MKETHNNGFEDSIAQAIEEMKSEQGNSFSLGKINLAELQHRTGVSRVKLRRLKENNFEMKLLGHTGHKSQNSVLSGYSPYPALHTSHCNQYSF